ncbi:uncharacterized protein VNE69_06187 [Vairimorpha necatrix]
MDCEVLYERINYSEEINNYKHPSIYDYKNDLHLRYINKKEKVIILDVNYLQNILDYKLLKKKLDEHISMWKLEDSRPKRRKYSYKNMEENEQIVFRKTKLSIRRKFEKVYTVYQENINTIKMAAKIIAQDEYTNDIEDQLNFFESFFEFFKFYITGSYFNYKSDGYTMINYYGALPLRMNILMNEFQIVDRFKTFKNFYEYAYPINTNETDKNKIQHSFDEIDKNIQFFNEDLINLCEECLFIINVLENLIYM